MGKYTNHKAYYGPTQLRHLLEQISQEEDARESIPIVRQREMVEKLIPCWQLKEINAACEKWLQARGLGTPDMAEQISGEKLCAYQERKMAEKKTEAERQAERDNEE